MQWKGRRESENVVDSRSLKRAGLAIGGGGSILVLIIALLLGADPRQLFQQGPGPDPGPAVVNPAEDEAVRFVKVVLADTEDVWHELFRGERKTYVEPKLHLFRGEVKSACGFASAASGPFYCPSDQHVYLDLQFFDDLKRRYKAPGDFAQAYVIAHEVGHHVQYLLGINEEVHRLQVRLTEAGRRAEANNLSVRLELQADFLAGVWAHHIQKKKRVLEPGDIDEALEAANAIGDDRLQKQAKGYIVPDSFTHGTSQQRIRWFRLGFESGDFSRRNFLFELDYNKL